MSEQEGRLAYDIPEAARILGISKNATYEAAKRGDIPVIKIGKLIRIPKKALHAMLDNAKGGAS